MTTPPTEPTPAEPTPAGSTPAESTPLPAPPAESRPARGPWRGRIARIAGAVGVLTLTAAVAAAGYAAPVPADVVVAPRSVAVPPSPRVLTCAGPLVLPDGAGTGDSAFDRVPVPVRTDVRVLTVPGAGARAASAGTLTPLAGGEAITTLDPVGSGAAAGRATGVTGATLLYAAPLDESAPLIGGATASVTTAGDLRGLSAASCQAPSADQWLVGGSTEIGNTSQLIVTNPGATAAQVTVELFGPSGRAGLGGSGSFLVAPGAEKVVVLAGVAAEQSRIAVHVSAAGGLITAHVQDNRLDGFTPAGTDLVSAGTAPARRQVVGGLVVPESTIDGPDVAQLRLLVPGDTGATATLSLLGPDGPVVLPGAETISLAPGEVTDVSLGGLPAGAYTAVVDADEPLVAAVMITRTGLPGQLDDLPTLERAWGAAAVPAAGGVVALPAGVSGTVLLAGIGPDDGGEGGGSATGTLRTFGDDGALLDEREVSVPAGTTMALPVTSLAGGVAVGGLQLVLPDTTSATATGDDATSGPAVLSWSMLGYVAAADGELVSVLTPVPVATATPSVDVRAARTLGLP
ncbi:DUF5719 family protein [Pengzhenrongella frigida]|uniref:Large extracellular alpha-helical protein n=1 Tax=Pengzhenrongella frigida TaxID=1259133 RepID=A0A4Q5N2E0_9MICO|nr:DUF5719 family protein [Cellulomonas sp. HLT2-17]RYV51393.1 hypothetical protein EUA98_08905 [Cellulomonas sp. HLT2-17]